jgi:hypothetical protein
MVNEPTGNPDPNVTEQFCVVRLSEHDRSGSPCPSDTVTVPDRLKAVGLSRSVTVTTQAIGCPAAAEPDARPALEHCMPMLVARKVTATVAEPQLGSTSLCPG